VTYELHHGDCLNVMRGMDCNSIDAIVSDPPYGLRFMGQKWDYDVPSIAIWEQCLRVLKPGGHLLAFGGTRTYHRMVVNIEDAGFEIRDQLQWIYGSGFPKSHDVSKAIDRMAGVEREVVGMKPKAIGGGRAGPSHEGWQRPWMSEENGRDKPFQITAPATPEAEQWQGWGTALKPAHEPIVLARKSIASTVAANVLEWGTGAINVDECRVEGTENGWSRPGGDNSGRKGGIMGETVSRLPYGSNKGRWPANVILDDSEEVRAGFPVTTSGGKNGVKNERVSFGPNGTFAERSRDTGYFNEGDTGSAARFFYCAKASKSERTCNGAVDNDHPTVKPIELMRYLCRLITPPGGAILDPFMGSGSTGLAALGEGFGFIGIERDGHNAEIARRRLAADLPLFAEATL